MGEEIKERRTGGEVKGRDGKGRERRVRGEEKGGGGGQEEPKTSGIS